MKLFAGLLVVLISSLLMDCVTYTKKFELQIIDKETGEPIPNIIIYHEVTKVQPYQIFDSEHVPVV